MKQGILVVIGAVALLGLFSLVPDQRVQVEVEPQETCRIDNIETHTLVGCNQITNHNNAQVK